jgi:hypothetical protein
VRILLEMVSERRLWVSDFLRPVDGPVTGAFGRQRIINGQAKNPHNGEDIAAPLGADVVAMNDGVVSFQARASLSIMALASTRCTFICRKYPSKTARPSKGGRLLARSAHQVARPALISIGESI